jgi:hypothetical protein
VCGAGTAPSETTIDILKRVAAGMLSLELPPPHEAMPVNVTTAAAQTMKRLHNPDCMMVTPSAAVRRQFVRHL